MHHMKKVINPNMENISVDLSTIGSVNYEKEFLSLYTSQENPPPPQAPITSEMIKHTAQKHDKPHNICIII